MRTLFKLILRTVLLSALWASVIFIGTLEGWWHTRIAEKNSTTAFVEAAKELSHTNFVGNLAFALIRNGQVEDEYFYSIGEPVDRHTLFQVASLSKWVTAWGIMTLVEKGKIDLDAPISQYLTRWQLPKGKFDNDGVTVRRLLSHTAGLSDGLGYGGFAPGTPVQPIEASLTNASDASPGAKGRVVVGYEPGKEWHYSGGGYTLLQLLIEEVSDDTFENYMKENVFNPLGMINSTYHWRETNQVRLASFYDEDSTESTHFRFTSLAATSLYTSLADMEAFLVAQWQGQNGETEGNGVLSPETLKLMREPLGYSMGAPIWGAGTMLCASNNADDFVIGHDGKNDPAINTAARFNPATGNGVIVLETGNQLLATKLGSEWVFWETGNVDFLMFLLQMETMLVVIGIGWAVILISLVGIYWYKRRTSNSRTVELTPG